jgi:RNA polymerase sigma-70 factor (ECF subfamily)
MAAENDTSAFDFDQVVAEHGPYVWRVLRRMGVRPADVEDVWQETFIVVHRKLDGFEGRASLRTWLSAIAVRVASDYRNRAHRRREHATDEVPDGGAPASQHQDLVDQERRALLDRLLTELKPEQREVVALYEFAELPMQEVAAALGCPLQTAYSRLHAARRALEQAARREAARRGSP